MQAEQIADCACALGEGPLWDAERNCLWWVDITPGRLWRWDAATGTAGVELDTGGRAIGGFTLQHDGALLLFMARGSIQVWDGRTLATVIDEIPAEREGRFNDVIADPAGRVFCGTMPTGDAGGRLYCLRTDGTLRRLLDGVGVSNGLGFTPDRRGLYYTDSRRREIYLFDYDADDGTIADRRVFARLDDDGVPDGLTVDEEGCVWSAVFGGSRVIRFAPDGTVERSVPVPTRRVTCPTFGGDGRDELFVTTARDEGDGGAVYRFRPGVAAPREFRSRLVV